MFLLGDFFSRLTIGYNARRKVVFVKNSSIIVSILNILYYEGLINNFCLDSKNPKNIIIFLKYILGKPSFVKIKLISKPSKRVFIKSKKIRKKKI